MQTKSIPRDSLLKRCRDAMTNYGMSLTQFRTYMPCFTRVYNFMERKGIPTYTESVGEEFCLHIKEETSLTGSTKKLNYRAIRLLNHIMTGLPYTLKFGRTPKEFAYHGEIGIYVKQYIQDLEKSRFSPITTHQKKRILSFFSEAMTAKEKTPKSLSPDDIVDYISCIQDARAITISVLKGFLRFLFEARIITSDLSMELVTVKHVNREKMISYYTPKEVAKIEQAIDRRTFNGKRNYAIILLASRLGLRISDISALTFSNIDWDKNLISFEQYKTKRKITLPLLADVGEAIIDYILYARPKTVGLDNIFITSQKPYRSLTASFVSSVIQNTVRKSGVLYEGRHTGGHCLRHSLATSLMNEGIQIPVISEILGHESSASTMFYLGVNVSALLACSMDVSAVPDSFYMQKGGLLYD